MKRVGEPVLLVLLCMAGCDDAAAPGTPAAGGGSAAWFADVASEGGLVFDHVSGHAGRYLLPEIMCGGAALFDMDGDGDLDAYLVQGGDVTGSEPSAPNRLYRNDGTPGAPRFVDVTAGSGAGDRGYGMGVATGDVDNDGDVDLYVTNCGPNVLLLNDGRGVFTDASAASGVDHPSWASSAAFVDYDNDGDLDLFVANYLHWSVATELDCYNDQTGRPDYCSPGTYKAPAADVLYRNDGGTRAGVLRFTDVTRDMGIAEGPRTGLGVVCGDFNGDGWPDIFVANDGMMDQLWINDRGAGFTDQALRLGCAVDEEGKTKAGMGVTASDLDDDGDLDLLVCNLRSESDSLHLNQGSGARGFVDGTARAGLAAVSRPFTRFGIAWQDFDNDGRLDLYQANGRVTQFATTWSDDPFAEPNLLFAGTAAGRFEEVTPRGGAGEALIATSRAAAFGDVDGDGGVDILVVNRDGRANLLHNRADRGRWIMFRVLDEHGRDALGATVTMSIGDRTVSRDVRTAYSYCAANDPRIHLGLGEAQEVTAVTVRWIDGSRESFGNFAADQIPTLRRGED